MVNRIYEEVRFQCVNESRGPGLSSDGIEVGGMKDAGVGLPVGRVLTEEPERAFEQGGCSIWR